MSYTAISKIARACASIPWVLKDPKGKPVENPEDFRFRLIDRPNPVMSKEAYIQALILNWYIGGEFFVNAVRPTRRPSEFCELWPIRPDSIIDIKLHNQIPLYYKYMDQDGQEKQLKPEDILHLKFANPENSKRGLSPLSPAALNIDQFNHSNRLNYANLKNAARPSGILTIPVSEHNPTGTLADEDYTNLKEKLKKEFSNENAGQPMLAQGGISWQQISYSNKDLQWLEGLVLNAKFICLAVDVPPILLNIEDPTYNNKREARADFWEDTVLPRTEQLIHAHNAFLSEFLEGYYYELNTENLPALAYKREQAYERAQKSDFLRINEKRAMVGLGAVPKGDVILVPMTVQPLEQVGMDGPDLEE